MFSFPENYGGTKDGFKVSVALLREVAQGSEQLQENLEFWDVPSCTRLWDLIPYPQELNPTESMNAILYLKEILQF